MSMQTMIVSVLLSLVSSATFQEGTCPYDLLPELKDFQFVRDNGGRKHPDLFLVRGDASLSIAGGAGSSRTPEERRERLKRSIEGNMALPPSSLGQKSSDSLHRSLSGDPLGDQIYRWEYRNKDGTPTGINFISGAETITLNIKLSYGRSVPSKSEYATDRLLVESVARRMIGQLLAWDSFRSVREGRIAPNEAELVSDKGKRYVAVASWAANRSIRVQKYGGAMLRLQWNGTTTTVLTATDKIKVGSAWRSMGGYAVEVQKRIFVPKEGFLAAMN